MFSDTASGALDERPELERLLDHLRDGDTLVVWRLDRLGRSLRHLIDTVTALADRGVGFRSLQESIDTTTPGGRLIFHVFGALAEFERELIRERTQAGLTAARARGRKGGRPSVMSRDKLRVAREMYESREHTIAAIAATVGVSRATLYRALAPAPAASPDPVASVAAPPPGPLATLTAAAVKPDALVSGAAQAAALRRQCAIDRFVLPNDADALQLLCPNCAARPGVMCRDTHSRARRRPAAPAIHMARYWRQRGCPTCRAVPAEPCRTPNGREAAETHTARRGPTQLESAKRQQLR